MQSNNPLLSSFRIALLAALATGCSMGGEPPLDNYLTRLGRSLDTEIGPASSALPALPRSRDLRIDLLPGSLNILDMLELADCRLNITIGKSNSSLGKLATHSQRLLLELEFLERAPECIDSLDPESQAELIATLETAAADKRRQLAARIWNATLGGPEFREFWKRPSRLGDYPAGTAAAVPTALERLGQLSNAWLSGDYGRGHDELEPLLGTVRSGDGGALLAALELQQQSLLGADPALQARLERPLCFGNSPSPEGQVFDTVVRKFFVGEVQPWSVKLERRRLALLAPVAELEASLGEISPPAYRDWRVQRDDLLASSTVAPRRHATALAELLESCGLRPGMAKSS